MIKGRLSRVRPTTQRGRSRLVGGGRGLKKRVTSKKHVPSFKAEKGGERGVHFTCLGCGFSNLAYYGLPLHTNKDIHTKLQKQPHEFRRIIPPQPPTQQSARPSSLRAFRMKVFSSEFKQCGERERGGRRDKLIFEHFQTPLSPPSPAALHRVWCVRPGQVLTPARTFPSKSYSLLWAPGCSCRGRRWG